MATLGLLLTHTPPAVPSVSVVVVPAHIDVTLLNVEAQNRPGWNLLVTGRDQLYPITGRNIYLRLADSLELGPGDYMIVAGDRLHTCLIKPISIKAGEYGSYIMDLSKKGTQSFDIADAASRSAGASSDDIQEMNPAVIRNPAMW